MTGCVIILAYQRGSATEESVRTSGDNYTFSFTLFTSGTPEGKWEKGDG